MTTVIYLTPNDPIPVERHVAVIAHQDGTPIQDKGYFFDSIKSDPGGSGPFDFLLNETIERAKSFAADKSISKVVVRKRR